MGTDLAEFLGAALGFHLLLGIGLFPAALITGATAFLILGLQRFGFRPFEAVIAAIVAMIGVCYVGELFYAKPPIGTVAEHAFVPHFAGSESVLLAVGILGATVMPHVIYLHSALMQGRVLPESEEQAHRLYKFTRIDVVIAMTLAGQVVMQGFIRRRIPVAVRRLVTMAPALVVIGIGVDPSRTLVISQVVLSFGIPFALIPLVIFTSRREIMGVLVNHRATTAAAAVIATLISALN